MRRSWERKTHPNEELGEDSRSDYIINTINASLLAAVKALTWQSHKMEIHLELTHMLAQSVHMLHNKLNSLSGKLDKWGNRWKDDNAAKGTRNDEIIDKLSTRPDLLTSLIHHCKAVDESYKKMNSETPVKKQQDTVPTELTHKGEPSASIGGEEESREMESNNRQSIMAHPMLLTSSDTNAAEHSTEQQVPEVTFKPPCEFDTKNNQQLQLARRQKKLKKTLKATKITNRLNCTGKVRETSGNMPVHLKTYSIFQQRPLPILAPEICSHTHITPVPGEDSGGKGKYNSQMGKNVEGSHITCLAGSTANSNQVHPKAKSCEKEIDHSVPTKKQASSQTGETESAMGLEQLLVVEGDDDPMGGAIPKKKPLT
ncbi:hypothetical protein NDU88_002008 [Pleurodeles waltl]|uniref:Uncharacterized protein n=1 Tax=Pleurodeles waltl TaxID=8319 RepID=A0AAV7M081_PLEWA|nr:hypothetical protein NDU88_002008 [Pleurodeles waltl]